MDEPRTAFDAETQDLLEHADELFARSSHIINTFDERADSFHKVCKEYDALLRSVIKASPKPDKP